MIQLRNGFIDAEERLPFAQALTFEAVQRLFRQVYPIAFGQKAGGLGEAQIVMLHEKGEYIAAGAAAETVKKPLAFIDIKRRGLFIVKGAQPLVINAHLFQTDIV